MCHLIFLVPLAGIPLFWILPFGYALLINILLWIVFGTIGYKIVRAMMSPPKDDFKSLVGTEATVVSTENRFPGQYLVKANHELWTARCAAALQLGERVRVTATNGNALVVSNCPVVEMRTYERYCH